MLECVVCSIIDTEFIDDVSGDFLVATPVMELMGYLLDDYRSYKLLYKKVMSLGISPDSSSKYIFQKTGRFHVGIGGSSCVEVLSRHISTIRRVHREQIA